MQTTRRQLLAHSAVLPFLPLVGLGLTACSTVETTSVQSRLRGKSITVISTVGTTLRLSWRGTTPFNNEFGEAFVPGWGLKEQLENSTVELLKASGRFSSVQRVTITSTRREEALKELKELKTPTDHVLLISGAPSADSIWATREGFFGLGIAQRSILQLGTESVAHASLRVDLLVPSTFGTVLGEAPVSTAQSSCGRVCLPAIASSAPTLTSSRRSSAPSAVMSAATSEVSTPSTTLSIPSPRHSSRLACTTARARGSGGLGGGGRGPPRPARRPGDGRPRGPARPGRQRGGDVGHCPGPGPGVGRWLLEVACARPGRLVRCRHGTVAQRHGGRVAFL